MKRLSFIFFLVGIACVFVGLRSCEHYYALNPPPEASQPGWDGDAHAEPYIAFERFFFLLAGGGLSVAVGCYLFSRGARKQADSA
jgi:hypothetical protein